MRRSPLPLHIPALVLIGAAALTLAGDATANPPGIPPGVQKVYSFNVIGYPADRSYDGNCGNGHRIFVNREAKSARVLVQNSTSDWQVIDCDATDNHQAVITTYQAASFDIFARILGRPGGNIKICGRTLEDALAGETLCLLGTIDLTRGSGQSKFSLAPNAMFDASLEDLLWTIDTNSNFRIVQFRVYTRPQ